MDSVKLKSRGNCRPAFIFLALVALIMNPVNLVTGFIAEFNDLNQSKEAEYKLGGSQFRFFDVFFGIIPYI